MYCTCILYIYIFAVMITCSLVGLSMFTVDFETDVFLSVAMTCHDMRFQVRHMIISSLLSTKGFINLELLIL